MSEFTSATAGLTHAELTTAFGDYIDYTTKELAALRALNVEMLGWLGTSNAMLGFWCPCCHKYDEHAPDCKLDALLQKGTPPRR